MNLVFDSYQCLNQCVTLFPSYLQNPFKICKSTFHWMTMLSSALFMAFGVVGLTFYEELPERLTLLPLVLAPTIVYPIFTLCVFTHPYPRLWHMRRRTREDPYRMRGPSRRWPWDRGNTLFPPDLSTSDTTSSDTAKLY